jgi:[protein-PII] uridylyltransferase
MAELPAPVARLLGELSALDRAYSAGHHGRWSAARRAELVDTCLRELFAGAEPPEQVALVALGGYGRGELLPASDVDLLILHDGSDPRAVAELAQLVLYPLWDAGLSVGHGLRTGEESLALAADRLDATTAMLDGRVLAGDDTGWLRLREAVVEDFRAHPHASAERLRADAEARRQRFGAASSLLEPDLKEGAGALRDVHVLGWLEEALGRTLEEAGLIRAAERTAVDTAAEFLVRVRSALHLQTGRATERLLLEQQPQVATEMGFVDEPGLLAVDGLMRRVFEHARQVEHVRSSVLDRFLGGASESVQVNPDPEGVLRAFASAAREHRVMPASALNEIDRATIPSPVEWTEAVRDAFFELLRAGDVRAFETLDRLGLLERFLPAWTDVRARPQRDPYHRFPVDVHLLYAFAGAARLLEDPGDDHVAAWAVAAVTDREGVMLGALLHDIGKIGEGNHVATGTRISDAALGAMRLAQGTRDLAGFLVAEHLLLSDTATRRDLEDDDLIHDVAARVGDPERLAALYLLTVADAGATGPLAWTPWRAALVRELVAKVQRVLERGEVGAETAERLAEAVEAIRVELAGEDPAAVERFILRMPRGYVLTVPPARVAREFALTGSAPGANEVRTHSVLGSRPGTYDLTVVAADRPGLLSLIAGALTLANLSILTAQVFTTADGAAVDLFEVEGAFEVEVGEERWRAFRAALRKALEGRLSLDRGVDDKRRHYPASRSRVPVRVTVDNDASDFFTVIEVGAPDRIGLLFDITRTFAELHLDVHLAKVATFGARVVDAFYVRDDLGRRLEDAGQVVELERTLRARLEG